VHFNGVGACVTGLDVYEIENSVAVVIVQFPGAVVLFFEGGAGLLSADLISGCAGRDVDFYRAGAGVAGLDEGEIREKARFCRYQEPSSVRFGCEGGASFENSGLEFGGCGGDVYFDCTSSCIACLDIAEVGNAITIGTGN
jgi:hypothetical protein